LPIADCQFPNLKEVITSKNRQSAIKN
jgi:hypothetical protein